MRKSTLIGDTVCLNLSNGQNNCDALGYIKHFGSRFESDLGLPVNAAASITGLTGGFGWLVAYFFGWCSKEIGNQVNRN